MLEFELPGRFMVLAAKSIPKGAQQEIQSGIRVHKFVNTRSDTSCFTWLFRKLAPKRSEGKQHRIAGTPKVQARKLDSQN